MLSDLEHLRRKIVEIGDVVMVIIDPMSAYFGGTIERAAMTLPIAKLREKAQKGRSLWQLSNE